MEYYYDDEDVENVEEYIRCYESELSAHEKTRKRLFGLNPGLPHLRAAPVFELFSVSVEHATNKKQPCRIYGLIAVLKTAEDDYMYTLYKRPKSDPEEILSGEKLSLNGYPVTAADKPMTVGVHLIDEESGLQLANGTFNVEYKSERDYDVRKTVTVTGEQGFSVKLCYNTFYSAIVGTLTVEAGGDTGVYGHVYASFDDEYRNKMGADKEEFSYLFKRPRKDPHIKTPLKESELALSRSSVVVPAGSYFWLVVTLREADTKSVIGRGKTEIHARKDGYGFMTTCRQFSRVRVSIDWMTPDELRQVNILKSVPTELVETNSLALSHDRSGFSKIVKESDYLLPIDQLFDDESAACEDLTISRLPSMIGICLVEVFSVVVSCAKQDSLGVHGTICTYDSLGTHPLFKRERDDYEILPTSRKSLSLRGPTTRSVVFNDFYLYVRLKDDKNRNVSKGYMNWSPEAKYYRSRDKRICSIIRGEFGHAAVHYTIFSSAAEVVFSVLVSCNNSIDVTAKVWGTVLAQYKEFDYSTYHQNEYYRSILFKEYSENPIYLDGNNSEVVLPLSKSVIAVPSDCSLLITLDLFVVDPNKVDGSSLVQQVLDFKPFCNGSQRIKTNNGFDLTICAEWKVPTGS